nr:integrase, catalytic region, zinc finger, CCHC-type, peptidase aspartic, catalytic [Tanacetum cinerariifolium]
MSFKLNKSKDFCKEREQYFEIQDLKAQLHDKSIAISELKKLIEKLKGNSMDTKFEKSLVIRQPNAFKSQRPSVLGNSTTFSNSFIRKDFSKSTSGTKNNVSNDFSKPVSAQTLPANKKQTTAHTLPTKKKSCIKNTNVLAPGMYKIHTDHTQARTSKLPQDSKKTNKRVSFSTGVISTTSVSRPQLKSNPQGDRVLRSNSRGKKLEVEEHRRHVKLSKNKMSVTACNDSLNAKTVNVKSVSAMCTKCVMIDKHDLCVPKYVAKPLKKTVASESIKKPRNNVRKLHMETLSGRTLSLHNQDSYGNLSLSKPMLIRIELKKLIEKLKGKSMDTKIEKSLVIRQPNAFKSPRPSVLGKPTTFSNSFIRKDFSKSTSVTKNNVSNDFSKSVPAQTLPATKKSCLKNMNVLALGMYKIHTYHTQARTSKPQLKSNPQGDRVLHSNSHGKKLEVEEHRRNVKFLKNKMSVTACNDSLKAKTVNVKSVSPICAKCVMIDKHDLCVPKSVAKPLRKTVVSESIKKPRNNLIEIILFIVDSGCSKHMTGNLKLLINFVEKFPGTVKFGNDQIAPILGYGDLVQGVVTIKRVYY